jgi:hypothetical protein
MNEQKSYNDKLRELGVTDESVEVHQCQDGIGLCVTRYRNQSGEEVAVRFESALLLSGSLID